MTQNAPFSLLNPHAPFEQLASAWAPLQLNGPKIESGGLQEPAARSEQQQLGRLRGAIRVHEATLANEALFTIPAGLRPVAQVEVERVTSTGKLLRVKITPAGVCSCTEPLVAGEVLFFDGLTYNLT